MGFKKEEGEQFLENLKQAKARTVGGIAVGEAFTIDMTGKEPVAVTQDGRRVTIQKVNAPDAGDIRPGIPITNLTISKTTDESKLNKTEKAFYLYLQMLKYPWVGVQCITLKLADDTRYTPDFSTLGPNGEFQFFETKGFFRDDAKVKLKVAARQFRMFQFHLVYKKKVKEGGGWDITPVKP